MKGILVVGTDTGVGKTFVARALCRSLRLRGLPVVGLKPFETGCNPVAQDAKALEDEAQSGLPLDLRCPFRFRAPLAPAVAAAQEGRETSVAAAVTVLRATARGRTAIVETAGGLLVPLSPTETNLDLAVALRLPVILVGRNALGTINHVALTARGLREHGLRVLGLVLSRGAGQTAIADPSQRTNLAWALQTSGVAYGVDVPRARLAVAVRRLEGLPLPWLVADRP